MPGTHRTVAFVLCRSWRRIYFHKRQKLRDAPLICEPADRTAADLHVFRTHARSRASLRRVVFPSATRSCALARRRHAPPLFESPKASWLHTGAFSSPLLVFQLRTRLLLSFFRLFIASCNNYTVHCRLQLVLMPFQSLKSIACHLFCGDARQFPVCALRMTWRAAYFVVIWQSLTKPRKTRRVKTPARQLLPDGTDQLTRSKSVGACTKALVTEAGAFFLLHHVAFGCEAKINDFPSHDCDERVCPTMIMGQRWNMWK